MVSYSIPAITKSDTSVLVQMALIQSHIFALPVDIIHKIQQEWIEQMEL